MTKSICFFSTYFSGNEIPYYIQVYLIEVKRHVSEVVLLCSNNSISKKSKLFLSEKNITLEILKNEGFDFGMWYKAFQKYPVHEYDNVLLANDSCFLISNLDSFFNWTKSVSANCYGLVDSSEIQYHIQSYFLWLNKSAILELKSYFKQNGIITDIQQLITTYEAGFCQHLTNNGFKIIAQFPSSDLKNDAYYNVIPLLKGGMPLIKKKIVLSTYRKLETRELAFNNFNFNNRIYIEEVKKIQAFNEFVPISKQIEEFNTEPTVKFRIWAMYFQLLGKIRILILKNQFLTNCLKKAKRLIY